MAILSSILPAVFTCIAFVAALRGLRALHPFQLWTGSWAVSTVLYALRLLPYRDLSWLTAGLICGSVVAFAIGVSFGVRLADLRRSTRDARQETNVVEMAAWMALALLAVSLAVFIAQLVSRFGVGPVLQFSVQVKVYLSSEAPVSGTYMAVAIVATTLCALAGALAPPTTFRRRGWLIASAASAATVYFSTSRGFIAVAIVAGLAVLALVWAGAARRRLRTVTLVAVAVIFIGFVGLGSLIGKTYGNSGIGEFDNFFSTHPAVSWLALPYQDVTAGIPALDLLVGASSTWGRAHGCATAPIACGVVRRLGVPAVRVPVAGPFTSLPLQWNAYTFLDRFLIDGGTALTLLMVALTGLVAGYWWIRAHAGSTLGVIVYAVIAAGLVGAYRQNLIELVLLTSAIATALVLMARAWIAYIPLLRRTAARGAA